MNIRHPLRQTWYDIKRRCYNPKRKAFKNYGGKGVIMCKSWLYNFDSFCEWAVNNGWEHGLQIDRIDVNGNYEPSNCRWVTKTINSKENKTNLLYITYKGQVKTLREWCRMLNISYGSAYYWIVIKSKNPEVVFTNEKLLSFHFIETEREQYFEWGKKECEPIKPLFDYKSKSNESSNIKPLNKAVSEFEYNYIMEILISNNYNKNKTAKVLKVDRKTLYNKISQFETNTP